MPQPSPTLAGFQAFILNVMGISTTVLPPTSPVVSFALAVAMSIVNRQLQCIPIVSTDAAGVALNGGGITIYSLAVYNLAGSLVLNYGQDEPDAPAVEGSKPPMPFFAWTRKQYNLNGFISGVISGSSDESTSQTLVVQEAAKYFTVANMQQLKDPWGRQYLSLAQSYGPSTWGIS